MPLEVTARHGKAANSGVGGLRGRFRSGMPPPGATQRAATLAGRRRTLHGAQRMQTRISGLLSEGASLEHVEAELIERCDLQQDEKSALWLYAWSLADRLPRPERDARACAALFVGSD